MFLDSGTERSYTPRKARPLESKPTMAASPPSRLRGQAPSGQAAELRQGRWGGDAAEPETSRAVNIRQFILCDPLCL